MPLDTEYITQLVLDEIAGVITQPDSLILKKFLEEEPEASAIREELIRQFETPQVKDIIDNLSESLPVSRIWDELRIEKQQKRRKVIYVAAASLFLAIMILIYKPSSKEITSPHVSMLISNNENINLDVLSLKQHSIGDLIIRKKKDEISLLSYKENSNKTVTFNTPAGRIYTITLPDGTKVTLNAESRIEIPLSNPRSADVSGEARFIVMADPEHPYHVQLPENNSLQVLGTTFNVNTYDKDQIKVALVQGIVKMQSKKDSVTLTPGNEITARRDGSLEKRDLDTGSLEWTNGTYVFKRITLEKFSAVVHRCYGIRVVVDPTAKQTVGLTGAIYKDSTLTASLNIFRSPGGNFDYEIAEDSVLHLK